jgi:hypothetical protein
VTGTGPSTHDPPSAEAVFEPVDTALTDPLPVARGTAPGAGALTLHLAERVSPRGRVYAVDVHTVHHDLDIEHDIQELVEGPGFSFPQCKDSLAVPISHVATKEKFPETVRRR